MSNIDATYRIFNSSLEVALRVLFILVDAEKPISLQRIIFYDYLLLHSGDIPNGPSSLHPKLPNRASELLIKKPILEKAIHFMYLKDLLNINIDASGITYFANEHTKKFVDEMHDDYSANIKERSWWISQQFSSQSDEQMSGYINAHLSEWSYEFF